MISTTVVTKKGEGVMSKRHNIQGPANFFKFSICRVILTVTNQYYTLSLSDIRETEVAEVRLMPECSGRVRRTLRT
jgi:hypothetical protein